jgi:hypothetical protein
LRPSSLLSIVNPRINAPTFSGRSSYVQFPPVPVVFQARPV